MKIRTLFKTIPQFHFKRACTLLLVLVLCVSASWGADRTWSGGAEGTWSTAANWSGTLPGAGDQAVITGSTSVTIDLTEDVTLSSLKINMSSNSATVTLRLNGHKMTLTDGLLMGSTGSKSNYDGHFTLQGAGSLTTKGFDTGNDKSQYVTLQDNVIFTITETLYGNMDTGKEVNFYSDGTAKMYIPASGANVSYGANAFRFWLGAVGSATEISGNTGSADYFVYPYGTPQTYKITTAGDPWTGSGLAITFVTAGGGSSTQQSHWWVEQCDDPQVTWTFGGFTLCEDGGASTFKGDITYETASPRTKTLYLKAVTASGQSRTPGRGLVLKFKTPDGSLELLEIRYVQGEVMWTGATSDAWGTGGNWSSGTAPGSADPVIIPAGCANYPKLTGDVEIGEITVKNNAFITQTGGTLTINKLSAEGTGRFESTDGTVSFKGTDAGWSAEYPNFSTFTDVQIASSARFAPSSDLYVNGSFMNAGGQFIGTNAAVYFQGGNHTITGGGDAADTRFSQLLCTGHGGRTVTFNGKITVDMLNLSGTSDASLVTVDGGTGAGITVTANQNAYFVNIKATAPVITGGTCSAFSSTSETTPPPTGWGLVSDAYVWLGNSKTWSSTANWSTGTVPDGNAASILISATAPIAPEAPSITEFVITGTLEIDRQIDWSAYDLKVSGTGSVKFGDGSTSSVIKLKSVTVSTGGSLTVSENCTLNAGGAVSRTGNSGVTNVSGIIKGSTISLSGTTVMGAKGSLQATGATTLATVNIANSWDISGFKTGSSVATLNVTGNATFSQGANASVSVVNVGTAAGSGVVLTLGTALTAGTVNNNGTIALAGCNFSCTTKYNGFSDAGTNDTVIATGSTSITIASGSISTFRITDDATLGGTFSCGRMVAAGLGGKTLTVNGTVSVGTGSGRDTLQLTGTAASKLNVAGTGTIKLNASQSGGKYLAVTTGPVVKDLSGDITVTFSTGYSSGTAPTGWRIEAGELAYIWTGATDSSWSTISNWQTNALPPDGDDVIIQAVAVGKSYPVLTAALSRTGSITIDTGAELDAASYDITCGSFTNSGTLKIAGSITIDAPASYDAGSTVEYYTASSATIAEIAGSGKPTSYGGLVIGAGVTLTATGSISAQSVTNSGTLSAAGSLTVTGGITNDGTISVTGGVQFASYTGAAGNADILSLSGGTDAAPLQIWGTGTGGTVGSVHVTDDTFLKTIGSITIKDIEITADKTLTLKNAMTLSGTLTNGGTLFTNGYDFSADQFTGTGAIKLATTGTIAASAAGQAVRKLIFAGSRTWSGGFTNISFTNVDVLSGVTFTASSAFSVAGSLTNAGTLSAASTLSAGALNNGAAGTVSAGGALTVTAGALINEGALTADGALEVTAGALTNSGTVTAHSTLSVGGALTNGAAAAVTADSDITVTGVLTNNGAVTASGSVAAGTFAGTGGIDVAGATAVFTGAGSIPFVTVTTDSAVSLSGGVAITALTVGAGKTLTLGSALTLAGTLTNKGTVITGSNALAFSRYSNGGVTTDVLKITAAGGSITSSGTAAGTLSKLILEGDGTVTSTGTGVLTVSAVSVDNDLTFTVSGAGAAPVFNAMTVAAGKTLTLGSALTLTGALTNGTGSSIICGDYNLAFGSYSGAGTVSVGDAVISTTSGTDQTIQNIIFNKDRAYSSSGWTHILFTNLTVNTGKSLTLGSNLTLTGALTNKGTVITGSNSLTFNTYSNGGVNTDAVKITAAGGSITNTGAAAGTLSKLILEGDGTVTSTGTGVLTVSAVSVDDDLTFTVSGAGAAPVFTALTVAAGKTLTLGSALTAGTLTNNGKITSAGKNLGWTSYTGKADASDALALSGNLTLTGTSGKAGTVTYAGGGTLTGSGSVSLGTLTVGTGGDTTLAGTFAVDTLVATGLGGKTLTINATLTVGSGVAGAAASETLKLQGSSAENKLTVKGAGTGLIKLNTTQAGSKWVDATFAPEIRDLGNVAGGVKYYATFSTPAKTDITQDPKGWQIYVDKLPLKWLTATAANSDWSNAANWNEGVVPTESCGVEIDYAATGRYPVLAADAKVVDLLVEAGAVLDCAGYNLESVTEAFTINGMVRVCGDVTFKKGNGNSASWGSASSIEYYNPTPAVPLTISPVTGSAAPALSACPDLTVGAGVILSVPDNLTVSGTLTNSGTIKLADDTSLTVATYVKAADSSDTVSLSGGSITASGAAVTVGTIELLKAPVSNSYPFAGVSSVNLTVAAGVSAASPLVLPLTSALTVSGTLTNGGRIAAGNYALSFGTYVRSGAAGSQWDEITVNGGSLSDTGTTAGTITKLTLTGDTSVTTSAALTLADVVVDAAFGGVSRTFTTTASGSGSVAITSLSVGADKTLVLGSALTAGTITNNGTITSAGKNLGWTTYTGKADASDALALSGNVTLSGASGKIGAVEYAGGGTLTGSGTVSADSLTVAGTGGDTTLAGTFAVDTLTATGLGGKTLTINGTITVGSGVAGAAASETLRLSGTGTAAGQRLSVAGSGTIKLNAVQVGGKWLAVSSTGPVITDLSGGSSVRFTAEYSSDPATPPAGWVIFSGGLEYRWNAAPADTSWMNGANWNVGFVPPATASVIIAQTTNGRYPLLAADLAAGGITIETGAELDFATYSVTCTGAFANNGTVRVGGSASPAQAQGSLTAASVTSGPSSSVDYYGVAAGTPVAITALSAFSGAASPANLTTGTDVTLSFSGAASVSGTLTNNGTISLGHDLTVGVFAGTGSLTVTGSSVAISGTSGTVPLISVAADSTLSVSSGFAITDLTVAAGKTLTAGSALAVTGTLTNNGTVSVTGSRLSCTSYAGGAGNELQFAGGTEASPVALTIGSGTVGLLRFTDDTVFEPPVSSAVITDVTVHAGKTLTLAPSGTHDLTVSGTLTNNGTVRITGNGILSFGPSGTMDTSRGKLRYESLSSTAQATALPVAFNNLEIAAGTWTLSDAADTTVNDLTILSGATLKAGPAAASSRKLTVEGDFINGNGSASQAQGFIAQSGTVCFADAAGTGASHRISGSTSFHGLVCTTAGSILVLEAGQTQKVASSLTVTGSAAKPVRLQSSLTAGSDESRMWFLSVEKTLVEDGSSVVITNAVIADSKSVRAIMKPALSGCTDGGNTVNWFEDPPTYLLTMAPVGSDQLYVLFSTAIETADRQALKEALRLTDSTGTMNLIDQSGPVRVLDSGQLTAVVFQLTRSITWNDLFSLHVTAFSPAASNNIVVKNSGFNTLDSSAKHTVSDFAINAVEMLFAYDNYAENGSTARSWDSSSATTNRLHAQNDLLFQARLDSDIPSDYALEMVAQLASKTGTPSVAAQLREKAGLETRLWLPSAVASIGSAAAGVPLDQYIQQESGTSGQNRSFNIRYDARSSGLASLPSGDGIQFMFQFRDSTGNVVRIDTDCDGVADMPLYALRLTDRSDITSVDLWSVSLQSTTLQRGGVTILNNVINPDQGESCNLEVDMPSSGSLTVQVLTLDGSVVTTLSKGRKNAGTQFFSWDGKNGAGRPVARGMYFVRIIGPEIDETRKIMVVRD